MGIGSVVNPFGPIIPIRLSAASLPCVDYFTIGALSVPFEPAPPLRRIILAFASLGHSMILFSMA